MSAEKSEVEASVEVVEEKKEEEKKVEEEKEVTEEKKEEVVEEKKVEEEKEEQKEENTDAPHNAAIHALSEQLLLNTRRLLPLLITIHSNDISLTRNALEHLYHFVISAPTAVAGGVNDPLLEVILSSIYDCGLTSIEAYATDLINLVLKIVGSFPTIPQTCMFLVNQIVGLLQCSLGALQEQGLEASQLYDQLSKGVKSYVSLMEERVMNEEEEERKGEVLTKIMTDFGSMLESAGNVMIDDIVGDMIAISRCVSSRLSHQNYTLLVLMEIVLMRKQGRVGARCWRHE